MRRFYKVTDVTLKECGRACPNWEHHDGMGYSEDWFSCNGVGNGYDPRECRSKLACGINGFPNWCPLLEIEK